MKNIIVLILLCFTFSMVSAQTYLQENFDAEIPATWTITDEGEATGDSWVSGQQGTGNSLNGSNTAIVDSDSNGNGTLLLETLTSPIFDASTATALFLDFDQFYNNIGDDTAVVEIFDGTNWIEVLNQTEDAGGFNNPDQQHIDITAYANTTMQVRFIYDDGDSWAWYWMIDNVQVYNSTCNFPSDITIANITAFTADISWIAGGAEMDWEVVVQPAGTGEPTSSGTMTNNNPYGVTDLTPVTDYEVWVRSNCDADGFSVWAGPVNFQSACDVFVPEYVENFETIIPDCWDEATDGDATTGPIGLGAGSWANDGFLNNGFTGSYKINLWQAAKSDWILSPQFDLTGGPFQVDFDFGIMQFGSSTNAGVLGSDDTVELLISTDNGATWVNLVTFDSTSTVPATGTQVVFDLTAYAGQTVQFGILGSEGTVDDTEDNDIFVDNFRVRAIPSCQEPTNLAVSSITGTSVDITWDTGGTETNWEYVVIPAGSGPPTDAGTISTTNAVAVTDLDFNTDYEVWVRADCGEENGFSTWVGPVEFTTTIQTDFDVDCSTGPLPGFLCYGNNDSLILTYTSTDGSPLNLSIIAGEVEGAPFDFLVVYDTDGSELYNDEGNDGDISGLIFQSTGDTISFQVTSDGSVSCESSTGLADGIDFTVACATCINPTATYQIIDDCDNGEQFLVDVNVTSLGDATSLTLSNNVNADTVSASAEGIYQLGPFPFATDVVITISNDQDINCVINSSAIRLEACPPDNDSPCDATVAAVNADDSCSLITSGTLLEATDSGILAGTCVGDPDDDVWFQFTALEEFQIIQLTNIDGGGFTQNLDHTLYEGTCDAPIELYCSDADASLTTSLTVGNTYYIRVFSAGDEPVDYTFDLCIRPGSGNVSVDQTTYTPEELVIDILIDSECAQISNVIDITGSTGFGSTNGIGYFSAEEGSFPFEEGIILTTGDASRAGGPNFDTLSDGSSNWPGDTELDGVLTGSTTTNATILEFDFIPFSNEISFDFLMASEEYDMGNFECTFSDAFAFFLTDSNGVTTNLAVIPGTNDPILVTNIHPDNGFCPAVNEEYFGGYIPENLPPISFDGRTEVFTAFSPVNIGETYNIKLVIGDASTTGTDTLFDSAVFLRAGSFDIGEVELGEDITIEAGTAVCGDETITIQTQAVSSDHFWFKDGLLIAGENSNVLEVSEPGEYSVQIIILPGCPPIVDSIIVEFIPLPPTALTPPDLIGCSNGADDVEFILSNNDSEVLLDTEDPENYTITYHLTEEDASNGNSSLSSPYTSVSIPQTIYTRVLDNTTGCKDTKSFDLVLGIEPSTSFTTDFNYEVCPDATVPIIIEATPVNYDLSEVTIKWFRDGQPEAIAGENGLTLPVLEGDIYTIEVTFNDTGCLATESQEVITLESCFIPQGISPNNDGRNDTFDLSNFRVTKLEIFNRFGASVYSKVNYVDEWFGQTDGGDELPVGTYFYSVEFEDRDRESGWIYIQREN